MKRHSKKNETPLIFYITKTKLSRVLEAYIIGLRNKRVRVEDECVKLDIKALRQRAIQKVYCLPADEL